MGNFKMSMLQKDLDWIAGICSGKALPFTYFFESKKGISDLQPFAERLIQHLPNCVTENEREAYLHFFKSSIAFIISSCSQDDHVMKSLNVIAPVFLRQSEGQTTFERMLERETMGTKTSLEKRFFALCVEEHNLFKKTISAAETENTFTQNVKSTVDNFLESEKLYMSDEIYNGSEVQLCISMMIRQLRVDFQKTMVMVAENEG